MAWKDTSRFGMSGSFMYSGLSINIKNISNGVGWINPKLSPCGIFINTTKNPTINTKFDSQLNGDIFNISMTRKYMLPVSVIRRSITSKSFEVKNTDGRPTRFVWYAEYKDFTLSNYGNINIYVDGVNVGNVVSNFIFYMCGYSGTSRKKDGGFRVAYSGSGNLRHQHLLEIKLDYFTEQDHIDRNYLLYE